MLLLPTVRDFVVITTVNDRSAFFQHRSKRKMKQKSDWHDLGLGLLVAVEASSSPFLISLLRVPVLRVLHATGSFIRILVSISPADSMDFPFVGF